MKRTQNRKKPAVEIDEMLPEYRFDYRKARPNRFAGRVAEDGLVVVLDPEVSEFFSTAQAVNRALRTLMPTKTTRSKAGRVRR